MDRVGVMEATEETIPQMETPTPEVTEPEAPSVDPNETLFDGGPTRAEVDAWKDQHGDVYVTEVGEEKYVVWRTLTRFEYRRLVKMLEQQVSSGQISQAEANLNNEEAISELCILYPKLNRQDMSGDMAGIPSIISQQVMEASAFVSVQVRQL